MSEDRYVDLLFMAFGVVGWAYAPMAARATQWWHDNLGMPILVPPRVEAHVIRFGASLAFLSGFLRLVFCAYAWLALSSVFRVLPLQS